MTVLQKCWFKQVCPVLILYCIIAMWFFQDVGLSAAFIIRLLVGHLDALNRRWWITSVEVLAFFYLYVFFFLFFLYVLCALCAFLCFCVHYVFLCVLCVWAKLPEIKLDDDDDDDDYCAYNWPTRLRGIIKRSKRHCLENDRLEYVVEIHKCVSLSIKQICGSGIPVFSEKHDCCLVMQPREGRC